MKLSVIIPTYNRAQTIERAIESVFAQNCGDFMPAIEVIVVDDGSTDTTAEIVRSRYPQVRYRYQPNSGVSAARNSGLALAEGEWIAFLDSDDEWLPNKLVLQISLLQKTGLQVCHTEEIWMRNGVRVNQMNKHQKKGGWIFETCLPLCAMSPSSIVIHRSVFDTVGLFDEDLPACEDYDLWLRLSSRFEVCFVDEPCIKKYGGHSDQLSRRHWGMDRFRVIALERCLSDPRICAHLDSAQKEATKKMLLKKLTILLNGANKRNNYELAMQCQVQIDRWSN